MTIKSANKQAFFKHPSIQNHQSIAITPLHEFILKCDSVSQLNTFITQYGEEAVKTMACTTDAQGQIPIDIFRNRPQNNMALDQVRVKMIDLSIPSSCKSLITPFKVDEPLQRYRHNNDESLNSLLAIACDIGNTVKQIIKKSSTHPETNLYDNKTKKELDKELKDDPFESLIAIDPDTWEKAIEQKHRTHSANDNGCCKLALCYLQELYPHINAQLLKLTKSPRTFLIIEPKRGEDAIILDIWGSKICLYSERFSLQNHHRIDTNRGYMNILTTINPEYEQFELANKVHQQISDALYYLTMGAWFVYMGYRVLSELTHNTADYGSEPESIPPLFQF